MPKFGNASKQRLATVHPDLQKILNEAIKYYDFSITEGYRALADQKKYVSQGKSKTMNSKHLLRDCPEYGKKFSYAVDIVPYFSEDIPHVDYNDKEEFCYLAGFIMGIAKVYREFNIIQNDIVWGGRWSKKRIKYNTFVDMPHIEIKD